MGPNWSQRRTWRDCCLFIWLAFPFVAAVIRDGSTHNISIKPLLYGTINGIVYLSQHFLLLPQDFVYHEENGSCCYFLLLFRKASWKRGIFFILFLSKHLMEIAWHSLDIKKLFDTGRCSAVHYKIAVLSKYSL